MDKQILDEYQKILLGEYEQNFEGLFFHPESGGADDAGTHRLRGCPRG